MRTYIVIFYKKKIKRKSYEFQSTIFRGTLMKNYLSLTLLLLCSDVFAHHFPTTPPNTPGFPRYPVTSIKAHLIYEGDEVFIGYSQTRLPCLTKIPNVNGNTEYIQIDNNNIEITVSGSDSFTCLDLDMLLEFYQFYSLGRLPKGIYNIQMYWTRPSLPFPTPPNSTRSTIGQNIQFEVLAPVVIPMSNPYSLIIFGGIIMLISLIFIRFNESIPLND